LKTTNPTKTSADNRTSHHLNKQFVKRTSLPFVILVALVGAAIATGLTISNRRQTIGGIASSDQQHKGAARVGESRSMAQPKTPAVDQAILRAAGIGNAAGIENKFSSSSIVPSAKPATTAARSTRVAETSIDKDTEQSSQTSPLLRSDRIPYTSTFANSGNRERDREEQAQDAGRIQQGELVASGQTPDRRTDGKPREERLTRAHSFEGDLRKLPLRRPIRIELPEREGPELNPIFRSGGSPTLEPAVPNVPNTANPPAPSTNISFDGLDFANWGAGHPPDTVGDVGPTYFIQAINSSIGIFRKSDGVTVAAFTLNTFMSQGNFGNLCDTNNFGDPVVLYDTFEDRWIITDFAFQLSGGNVVNPPGAFQCIATSKTGDPVSGGWNFYSINTQFGLGDYPKFGIWTDGLYMSANVFGYPSGAAFQNARAYAFNKQQMYAGNPTVQVVSFDILGNGDFTVIPSNARLQSGTPPVGTPNYFVSSWLFLNALTIYKFHVDWNNISTSTFTGPDTPIAATSWPNAAVPNASSLGGNALDVLQIRAMMQNQYSNIGGVESLWDTHTVRRANTSGFAAPRWYQVDVTGSTVNANIPQAATWDPDGANVISRFMPSLAVDRVGDMALGYSTSSSTTKPAIKYAGRLFSDPVNTFSQTEQLMIQGAGTQTGTCGGVPCIRWGDYSAMSLDPDGCTFWYTNMYYAADGLNHQTRIASFGPFAGCTPVGAGGTLSGTVTAAIGGAPIAGAALQFGSRSTATDGSGFYSFSIPAGTYSSLSASQPGFVSGSASSIAITDGNITTQNFSLANAPASACDTDTTQADLQTGVPTGVDLTTTPGSAILSSGDPQNAIVTNSGVGITTTTWGGQTFTPLGTGQVTKIDVNLFCNVCSGSPQNLTVGIRATSGGVPAGADLATATIPGFLSGTAANYSAVFASPPTLTGGTMYAFVIHPNVNPTGTYAMVRSGADVYSGGTRVSGASSGTSWSIPLTTTMTTDAGFRVWMTEVLSAGNLVSEPKDANPAASLTPIWSTLSWNASTPANTSISFQVAGSNSASGPFNFVGPDGTAGTFFTTSPASLTQFYGLRYLEYKAYLSTTDNNVTPSLDDITICINDVDCSSTTATITPTPAAVCENSTGNTASGPAGMTSYAWGITNGTITSATNTQSITYTAGASGTVTLNLTVNAPNGCLVSNSVPVAITPTPATPTITPGGPTTFCQGGSVNLSSSSATGNQWYLNGNPIGGASNQVYNVTASGGYTVVVSDNGCPSAASAITTVTVNPLPATPTITPGGPTTFCQGGSVNLSSSSATGNQWYLNGNSIGGETSQVYSANASGNYTVVVMDGNACASAPSTATTVTVNPLPPAPTINAGGATTFCQGGSVTLTSNGATGNQWYLNGNPIGGATNNTYVATASGNYTAVVTDGNSCSSSPSAAISVTVNPTPATPTITPGGATTFCAGGSVTLNSSSATGNQWYLNGNQIVSATNQSYVATASGNYSVIDTELGCPSAPSAATAVTVNPNPDATIITAAQECAGSTGNTASVANAGVGATYNWSITNGTITGGTGTASITYTAGAVGSLTLNVTVTTAASCSDSKSANVNINAIPAKPTITPGGPTTFATGGSVTLNSSSVTGNQWYLNGNPIGGATNQSYNATASGNYTVVVTTNSCSSSPSAATTVTVCPITATVTNTNNSGAGSLRQAISDLCVGGTITFSNSTAGGATNFFDGFTHVITLTSGELAIANNLTITGPGASLLTISGNHNSRVFNVNLASPGVVTLSGMTVTNGTTSGDGGGITNQGTGTLNVTDIALTYNSAGGSGGGVANGGNGTLTVNNSTIVGNTAVGSGAGVSNGTGANQSSVLTINGSTINNNTGQNAGGGVFNVAHATITNSTVSSNGAVNGGGIANLNPATLTNVTVAGNTGTNSGGGIYNPGIGTITFRNTIIAGNTSPSGPDCNGSNFSSADHNLIGNTTGGSFTGTTTHNVTNVNALLGALGNYGGPTQTVPLLPGSPAIDAGDNCVTQASHCGDASISQISTDQRDVGFNRAINGTVDMGAFESRGFTVSATGGSGQSAVFSTAFSSPLLATVSSAFAEPVVGGQVTYTAPLSGASVTFTGGVTTLAVTINASNQVVTNATANNIVGGPYNVSAGSSGIAGTATFSLTNTQSNQTITFNPLANKTFGDADFPVSATASSGLPVSFMVSGQCTISTNSVHLTGAGSCTMTAKQAGNSNYNAAPDVVRAFTIAQASTTTAVSSSANPSNLTQSVTLTGTVSGPAGAGTPTGTATFKDGAATIVCANAGGQTLNGSGVATCQTSALTAGAHTITAVYSGDTNFLTSTGTLSSNQVVNNLPLVSFSAANYNVNESDGVVHVIVTRTGDTTVPFNVGYATSDTGASTNCAAVNTGLASSACDYTAFSGTLNFAANQNTANIDIPINQDSYTEGPESFTATLSNATNGAILVGPATTIITISDSAAPAPNAIDDNSAFVRQHYHDFLNREPDAAGLAFWVNGLNDCADPSKRPVGQTQAQCLEVRRVLTSSAFFLSIEFMQTGTFVRSFYVAALNRPSPPSANATDNLPSFSEWLRDTQAVQRGVIVNQGDWQATLDANRLAFMRDFVTRTEFVGLYPTTDTPAQYINKLYSHALARTPTATELSDVLSLFGGAPTAGDATARGQALLKVTQASDFISREIPRAFVQFEYFGYLRRNPNDAPDNNFNGYNFWLNKLNLAGGDFLKSEMVKAFINSPEYRQRFGSQ